MRHLVWMAMDAFQKHRRSFLTLESILTSGRPAVGWVRWGVDSGAAANKIERVPKLKLANQSRNSENLARVRFWNAGSRAEVVKKSRLVKEALYKLS